MANPEHVAKLKEGVEAWNEWHKAAFFRSLGYSTDDRRLDRFRADLQGIDLRGMDLYGVDFSRAELQGTDLRGVDFREANLRGAALTGADLRDTQLQKANLRASNLNEVNLTGVDLRETQLEGASLKAAILREANLSHVFLYRADLGAASLFRALLLETNCHGAILGMADLQEACLCKADLREADLSEANLHQADLRGANLHQADLRGATLSEANLSEVNLQEADLNEVDLSRATLIKAHLQEANFSAALLKEANLMAANLLRANFQRANLQGTTFDMADLSRVELFDTLFIDTNLSHAVGLQTSLHHGPSPIDFRTLRRSWPLPLAFLRGVGLDDDYIEYLQARFCKAIQFYSCFISYSSRNQDFAECLHADLQDKGVRCWFAPEDLKIGDRIRSAIHDAIRLHDKLLLILSEHSVASDWVEDEVESAIEREKDGSTVLFPVRIDDAVMDATSGWAASLRRKRHIGDFRQWKDHDAYRRAFERLLRDLKQAG